jgi:2-iminobutanoate/2-iminopropanoate deaminase
MAGDLGNAGLSLTGDIPKDISGQAELAWGHIVKMLERAGMTGGDIVKVTQYLTRAEDVPAYAKVRRRYLGEARPSSMLLVVSELVWPQFLVEVEVVAASQAENK